MGVGPSRRLFVLVGCHSGQRLQRRHPDMGHPTLIYNTSKAGVNPWEKSCQLRHGLLLLSVLGAQYR